MSKKSVWIGIDIGKETCVAAVDFPNFESKIQRKKVMDLDVLEFKNSQGGVKYNLINI